MPVHPPLVITAAVEGTLDQVVLQRLIEDAGGAMGPVHGRKGKNYLRKNIGAFNHAAKFTPWIVLVDLDQDADCAPSLRQEWLQEPNPKMEFRVAVHEVEAWLLGDRDRLAQFLRVSRSGISAQPETLTRVKRDLVQLAASSRRREIVEDLVPRPSSGRTVGPAYSSRLAEFVIDRTNGWRPQVAAKVCPSLDRLIKRLDRLAVAPRQNMVRRVD